MATLSESAIFAEIVYHKPAAPAIPPGWELYNTSAHGWGQVFCYHIGLKFDCIVTQIDLIQKGLTPYIVHKLNDGDIKLGIHVVDQ